MTKNLILLASALLPASLMAQQKFTVSGNFKGFKNSDKIYLIRETNNGEYTCDSSDVKNGVFSITGTLMHPLSVVLSRNTHPLRDRNARKETVDFIRLYVETGNVVLTGNDSLKRSVIKNSPINQVSSAWDAMRKPIEDKLGALNNEYKNLSDAQRKDGKVISDIIERERQLQNEVNATGINLAKAYPNSYLSLIALKQAAGNPSLSANAAPAFYKLSPQLKNSETGKQIVLLLASSSKNKIGGEALDFTQNTVQGKAVKLSDFRGKYVLVDFWASWCGPCREENPNVLNAYNKYSDKNFTILGVSLDQQQAAWAKAVTDDHLPWTQISDLKGWDNNAALQYGIRSIPSNVLVDPNGKIVAKNLRSEELTNKLAEIFDKPSN